MLSSRNGKKNILEFFQTNHSSSGFEQKMVGIILVIFMFVIYNLWLGPIPRFIIGSISIYPMDIISLILFLLGLINLFRKRIKINVSEGALVLLAVIFVCSLLVGLIQFGPEKAVNNARNTMYFLSVTMFCSTLAYSNQRIKSLFKVWGWAAFILCLIVFVRWGLVASGFSDQYNWGSVSGLSVRVIQASPTLFLLQTLIILLIYRLNSASSSFGNAFAIILAIAVILLQHRTVWVIGLFVFAVLFVWFSRFRRTVFTSAPLLIVGIVLFTAFSGANIVNSIQMSATSMNNFAWRLESWRVLLNQLSWNSPLIILFGHPYGTGMARYMFGGILTTVQAHNYYVQLIWDLGILGLLSCLVMYLALLRISWKSMHIDWKNRIFFLLLFSQLLFCITYSPSFEQGIFLGMAISLYRKRTRLTNSVMGIT